MSEIKEIKNRPVIVYIVLNAVLNDSRVLKIAQSAFNLGYDPVCIGISPQNIRQELNIDNINIILYPKKILIETKRKLINDEEIINDLVLIADEIKKLNPVLIHTHDMYGLAWGAVLLRLIAEDGEIIPWVHDVHEYTAGITAVGDKSLDFIKKLEQKYIKEPDKLITVSPSLAELLIKDYQITEKISLIYNCPRLKDFKHNYTVKLKKSLGLKKNEKLAVWSGRVNHFRGTHTIVEAISKIEGLHFVIITNQETDYIDKLKRIAKHHNAAERLHIIKYVPSNEVTSFISDADLGIHAGTHEIINMQIALPNKLFEYLHANIPILVSDVPEMSMFVKNNNLGEIFKADNLESAILGIKNILQTKYQWSINHRKLKKEYSWESQEVKLKKIYKGLLTEKKGFRVVHGFTNAASQSYTVSNSLRSIGIESDCMLLFNNKFNNFSDKAIYIKSYLDQIYALKKVASNYDIIHINGRGIFFSWKDSPLNYIDLLIFKLLGKKIVFSFRGSEARIPSYFKKVNRYSYANEKIPELDRIPEKMQLKHIEFVRSTADIITVPDAELNEYIPEATVVPRAIDLSSYTYVGVSDNKKPLIIHAPTNRDIKGTEFILLAIEKLRNKNLDFNFMLIEELTNEEALRLYKSADIVIDQLRIGYFGVFALECMAFGKAVVSYIREDLLDTFPGGILPLAPANPDNISEVLEFLITNKKERQILGERARNYVETVHDSRKIALQYQRIYKKIVRNKKPVNYSLFLNSLNLAENEIKKLKKTVASNTAIEVKKAETDKINLSDTEKIKKIILEKRKGLFDPPLIKILPRIKNRVLNYLSKNKLDNY